MIEKVFISQVSLITSASSFLVVRVAFTSNSLYPVCPVKSGNVLQYVFWVFLFFFFFLAFPFLTQVRDYTCCCKIIPWFLAHIIIYSDGLKFDSSIFPS